MMAATATAAASAPGWSWSMIAIGLAGVIAGAVLMASLTTDWQRLPQHLRLLGRTLKAQAGWTALAVGSISVLVFY